MLPALACVWGDVHWHRLAFPCGQRPRDASQRVLMFSVQCDETAQRFRASRPERTGGKPGAKTTGAPLAAQVAVVSGHMLGLNMLGDGVSDDPYFTNTLVVAETSANILAEGLVRHACCFRLPRSDARTGFSLRLRRLLHDRRPRLVKLVGCKVGGVHMHRPSFKYVARV